MFWLLQDGSLSIEPDIDSGKTTFGVPTMWVTPQRFIARQERFGEQQYLVKWEGLGYDEATWEAAKDLPGLEAKVEELNQRAPLARQAKVSMKALS